MEDDIFIRKTNFSDSDWKDFNAELDSALQHLHSNFTSHDPNVIARAITETYVSLIDKYMPLKKISNKRKRNPDKPWISRGLKKSINTKFKLYKKSKKSGNLDDNLKYKKYLNVLTRTKQNAEHLYYKNLSMLYGQNKSKTWKLINEVSNRKRKSNDLRIKTLVNKNGLHLHI